MIEMLGSFREKFIEFKFLAVTKVTKKIAIFKKNERKISVTKKNQQKISNTEKN